MASAVRSLRACLPPCRRAPAPRGLTPRVVYPKRALSTTPIRRADDDLPDDDEAAAEERPRRDLEFIKAPPRKTKPSQMTHKEFEKLGVPGVRRHTPRMSGGQWDLVDDQLDHLKETIALPTEAEKEFEEIAKEVNEWHEGISRVAAAPKKNQIKKDSFWGEDEEDPDYMIPDVEDEDLGEDDILSLAHGKLEEFREYREYARVAAWQMPLLSKLARKFEPPKAEECLRFRYTTYMGEEHPAQSKVVVEFSPADLPLNEAQKVKLQKLLGPRLNPETNIAKMSCEQFDHQAQNKRYLGDLVGKLIAQAKDSTDMFTDVPLDTRHHQFKQKRRFPVHWRLTEERMREIEAAREQALLLDQQKAEAGTLIDGAERVEHYLTIPAALPSAPRLGAKRATR